MTSSQFHKRVASELRYVRSIVLICSILCASAAFGAVMMRAFHLTMWAGLACAMGLLVAFAAIALVVWARWQMSHRQVEKAPAATFVPTLLSIWVVCSSAWNVAGIVLGIVRDPAHTVGPNEAAAALLWLACLGLTVGAAVKGVRRLTAPEAPPSAAEIRLTERYRAIVAARSLPDDERRAILRPMRRRGMINVSLLLGMFPLFLIVGQSAGLRWALPLTLGIVFVAYFVLHGLFDR